MAEPSVDLTLQALNESGVLFTIKTKMIGSKKKLKEHEKEIMLSQEGKRAGVESSKLLIAPAFLKEIGKIKNKVVNYVNNRLIRFPALTGVFFCPADIVPEVLEALEALRTEFVEKVQEFCEPQNYYQVRTEAYERLGGIYSDQDYPSDPLRAFGLSFIGFSLEPNQHLSGVETAIEQFKESATAQLRQRLLDLLESASKELKFVKDDQGNVIERGRIRESLLEKMEKFVAFMNSLNRNINDDPTVRMYTQRLEEVLRPSDPQMMISTDRLKKDDDFREVMGTYFTQLKDSFAAQISADTIGRDINLEDD